MIAFDWSGIGGVQPPAGVVPKNFTMGIILGRLGNIVVGIGFALGFAAMAYGFLLLVISGGAPEKVKTGRNAVFWGAVGAFVSVMAWAFKNYIAGLMGITDPWIIQGP